MSFSNNDESGTKILAYNGVDRTEAKNTPSAPPDLLKTYYFGCGPCHPKWLQVFAKKRFYTFLLFCFTCLLASVASGFISVVLSTIETRYRFSSTAAGIIIICYDLSVLLGVIFVGYFGNKTHKPRLLGICVILLSIACFLFASPQFIFGRYDVGNVGSLQNEECNDQSNATVVDNCSRGNDIAYSLFIIASLVLGTASAPLYTVGTAFIDDIVYPQFVSLHIGAAGVAVVLGPAVGYALGSLCLILYVDPWYETMLTQTNPAWVGAWWIPFIVVAILAIFLSIPFLMYPKYLSDSYLVREERIKLMAKKYKKKYDNEESLISVIKLFPINIKRLLGNSSFIFAAFGVAATYILTQGIITFAPKYLENQFDLTASNAGFITGAVGIPASVAGVIVGAVLVFKFKWQGRRNILLIVFIIIVDIPILLSFLIHCPVTQLAGVTTPYGDGSNSGTDNSICVEMCNCTSTLFEPVCGNDKITYFSPCRAGCSKTMDDDFEDCSCIGNYTDSIDVTAVEGNCQSTCILILPTLILLLVLIFNGFLTVIPYQYFVLRVVADDQRALALGVQSFIWRTFGAVPGPLLFGAIFDSVCILWQDECGERGNCWLYDNDKLSYYVTALAMPCQFIALVLFFLSWLTYPKKRQETKEETELPNDKHATDEDAAIEVPNAKNPIFNEEESPKTDEV